MILVNNIMTIPVAITLVLYYASIKQNLSPDTSGRGEECQGCQRNLQHLLQHGWCLWQTGKGAWVQWCASDPNQLCYPRSTRQLSVGTPHRKTGSGWMGEGGSQSDEDDPHKLTGAVGVRTTRGYINSIQKSKIQLMQLQQSHLIIKRKLQNH